MTINLSIPFNNPAPELKPRITVIGVGGAGGSAVNNMIRSHLEGVEFIVANTDSQALAQSSCERRIQLGVTVTQGLGAGSRPDIGRIAAEEALKCIIQEMRGSNMVFIAAGMGGGTGTGAAPVIARAAREQGILTVGVVTKPFHFEGQHRMRIADTGIEELEQFVDTLIIIPNQNLFRVANERTTFADAFKMADDAQPATTELQPGVDDEPGTLLTARVAGIQRLFGRVLLPGPPIEEGVDEPAALTAAREKLADLDAPDVGREEFGARLRIALAELAAATDAGTIGSRNTAMQIAQLRKVVTAALRAFETLPAAASGGAAAFSELRRQIGRRLAERAAAAAGPLPFIVRSFIAAIVSQ